MDSPPPKSSSSRNENPDTWERVLATHIERYNPADEHRTRTRRRHRVLPLAPSPLPWRRHRPMGPPDGGSVRASSPRATRTSDETARLAFAFRSDANLNLASRYEGRLRRSYERAIRNLKDYRAGHGASGKSAPMKKVKTNPASAGFSGGVVYLTQLGGYWNKVSRTSTISMSGQPSFPSFLRPGGNRAKRFGANGFNYRNKP